MPLVIVESDTNTVLASADVALTASGTATVQAALHDTPMVIVYRVSALSYLLLRRLVTLEAIGMVNLIAGERIVPAWLEVVPDKMRVLVHSLPVRAQIDTQVQEQLIVEYYSK